MIRNVVSGVAIAVFMLLAVPTSSSAIKPPDDPTVLGRELQQISRGVCQTDTDCQRAVYAAANQCIQLLSNSTGQAIADCMIDRVDGVYKLKLTASKDVLIQALESAFGTASEVANQDDPVDGCNSTILGFPAWHNGLICDETGSPTITELNNVWIIVLNMTRWLLAVAAYAAAIFIIWGGFKYIKSQGDPGAIATAKTTIFQAVGGLGIALISTALVAYVQGVIR